MKKFGIVLSIFVMFALIGCASSGGGSSKDAAGAGGSEPYSVDLSTVKVASWSYATKEVGTPVAGVKNAEPFSKQYDGVVVLFDDFPDVTGYSRVTIKVKKYNAEDAPLPDTDGGAMVVVFYDVTGDLEGPQMGIGPNTPLKEFNLGGFQGQVSTDKGSRINLKQNPGGLLIQCSATFVKYIEIIEVTFHN